MTYTFPISVLIVMMVGTASFGTGRPNVAPSSASIAVAGSVPTIEMTKLDSTEASQVKDSKKNKGDDDDPIVPIPKK